MKGMIVGDWDYDIYEKALEKGFEHYNINILQFKTNRYFSSKLLSKIEYRIHIGTQILKLNRDLINEARKNKVDFIFFQRPTQIFGKTFDKLKELLPKAKLIVYHNDNPYIHKRKFCKYGFFFRVLAKADCVFVYRKSNIVDAYKYGAKKIKVLPPYFVDGIDNVNIEGKKNNDVIFVGHFENDGRDQLIKYLIDNGINIKIYGNYWERSIVLMKYLNINVFNYPLYAAEYRQAIFQTKIAIVFLSKHNNDNYTRRNFEIPAIGTFFLAPFNDEIIKFFKQGVHGEFYKNKEELLEKISYFLKNEVEREKIALQGKIYCRANYSNNHLVKKILNDISNI